MTKLSIDLETFSSVNITKCGLYKYVQSPDFEILLFSYAFNDGPVQLLDLARGDHIPEDITRALFDPGITKKAWNATFEWYCLSKAYAVHEPMKWLPQWQDTMIEALYCGYPGKLSLIGPALGLPQDKQKMAEGKALIKYFCVPCAPTKRNGGRTRNLPHHDPAKWDLFKTYNKQDVVTEREAGRILSGYPVPPDEWRNWQLDQEINLRGVAVDPRIIDGARAIAAAENERLTKEAVQITGLDNPNSTKQLLKWLADEGEDAANLKKETVSGLIKSTDDAKVKRLLEIRQQTGKASIKKYDAMAACACEDGRIRGLTQFYGANRTGRWCLTGDHEILTPNGWIRLDKWPGGPIACWSPSTEFISFQNAESLSFDFSGEMISVVGQRCEQICTPEHKMPFLGKSGEWTYAPMERLSQHRFTIPFTGRRIGTYSPEPDKLRVLIMTQADGHYTPQGDLRFHFHKLRKVERCKHLLRKCSIPFQASGHSDGNTTIAIKSRALPLWLRQFADKTFGYWLLDESPDVIFDELPLWDGYACGPNSVQYTTTNKQNAEIVQAAAILSGRSATLIQKPRSNAWSTAYYVNIWNNPGHGTAIRREQVSRIEYAGKIYCAKTKTGFFVIRRNGKVWITGNSGRMVQMQNLPHDQAKHAELAREFVKRQDIDMLHLLYPNISATLSQLIRTTFIPRAGYKFVVADFSAIEARVIAWWAGESWRQKIFASDGKIYEASAASMFGVPIETIGHDKDGNDLGNYALRAKGKVAELALGYQGSIGAMKNMGADKMGLSDEELLDIVRRWRKASPRIVDLWYKCERAAVDSIKTGRINMVNNVAFARTVDPAHGRDFMTITLPSGRTLFYDHPVLIPGDRGEKITYRGVEQKTHKWGPIDTYGGKLVENTVQAIARDCLAITMQRLAAAGFRPVFHVHDEVISEVPVTRKCALEEACDLMAVPIPWAPGLLLRAAGFEADFYKKD